MPACEASGSVLAATITWSQLRPLVMNVFWPLSTYSSPSSSARVLIAARSEPVPGSVIAIARIDSPDAIPGSQRCFCSSVAAPRM